MIKLMMLDAVLVGKRKATKQVASNPIDSKWLGIPDTEAAHNENSLDCPSNEGSDDDDKSYQKIKVSINV